MWKEIKCKKCKTQKERLFMILPPEEPNDCFCEKCLKEEKERRARK